MDYFIVLNYKDTYHAERIHTGHKNLEKLIIEALDKGKVSGRHLCLARICLNFPDS